MASNDDEQRENDDNLNLLQAILSGDTKAYITLFFLVLFIGLMSSAVSTVMSLFDVPAPDYNVFPGIFIKIGLGFIVLGYLFKNVGNRHFSMQFYVCGAIAIIFAFFLY